MLTKALWTFAESLALMLLGFFWGLVIQAPKIVPNLPIPIIIENQAEAVFHPGVKSCLKLVKVCETWIAHQKGGVCTENSF